MKLIDIPVHELSEKLHSGEISSLELTRSYLDRIYQVENKIHAYINIFEKKSLEMAKEADHRLSQKENVTPLTGIPIALKDNLCFEGHNTTCGSKILQNFIPPYNATVVQRLIDAGSVFLGKTNMDEFAMGSSTENSRFFKTLNPWDTSRAPGGSSGGSAAAVCAKETSLALGSDTGGSIRQPAEFCGITGMKPTYGTISRYGLVAFASSLDQIGPMGKNVKDISILMDIIAGHDPKDSTSVNFAKVDYYKAVNKTENLKGLKYGIPKEFFDKRLNSGIKKELDKASKIFENLGAQPVEISIPALEYSLSAYYIIAPSEASSNLSRYDGCRYGYRAPETDNIINMMKKTRREGFGDEVLRRIMIGTYCLSSGYYNAYYLKAQKVRTLIKRDFDKAFERCDFIFAPSTPTIAFKIGEKVEDPLAMYLSDIYTVSVNLAGIPALVIPCSFSENMPVGLQLIGKSFDELTLLKAGAAFQNVSDYHNHFPTNL
jgi:aspartyl-tRNA(Asn)/glutamyl-tRNA(Gln) amidotransferase subunit A